MYNEIKGEKNSKNRELIQGFYDSFEKLFKERQGKALIENRFLPGYKQSYIEEKIQSFISNGQISCHHDWGLNGTLIFQIELLYFNYFFNDKEYTYAIGFQFQGSTIKINCGRIPYLDSTPSEIINIIPIFRKYSGSIYNGIIGYPKTRAYISITRKLKNIEENNTEELCKKLFLLLEQSMDLINNIKQEIKNIGRRFFKYYAITKSDT
jgi:hypothetical protein